MIPYIWLIFMVNLGKYTHTIGIAFIFSHGLLKWLFQERLVRPKSGLPLGAHRLFHRWINGFKKKWWICAEIKMVEIFKGEVQSICRSRCLFPPKVENGGCFVFLKMLKFICGKKYLQRWRSLKRDSNHAETSENIQHKRRYFREFFVATHRNKQQLPPPF